MKRRPLGRTGQTVSPLCLGTMTFGLQSSEAESHRLLDMALERGVDFIDTAEMYPAPPVKEHMGRTETIIGNWLRGRGCRDRVFLATKVSGRIEMENLRGPSTRLSRWHIERAIEGSLRRLGTDHVDLYQLHWPDRRTNFWGEQDYVHDPYADETPIEETLDAMAGLVRDGKIRFIGLSNESPWGMMRYLQAAEAEGLPRPVTVQNAYCLLHRHFEMAHSEVAHREEIGLLAFSPLGMGALSGKYLNGCWPPGARMTDFKNYGRYITAPAIEATAKYVDLARRHGLDPAQMALAFVHARPFVTATIIGATRPEQLSANIDSLGLTLPPEVLEGIAAIHRERPNPCP